VNKINLNRNSPQEFCLNVILDNSNLENIPDVKLIVRTDQNRDDFSLQDHPDFTFDGIPDMYTFRYSNMSRNSKIKIKMKTSQSERNTARGTGFAGIMISDISTCLSGNSRD